MDKKETVWLTLDNLSMLFDRDKSVISRPIRNILMETNYLKISLLQKMQFRLKDRFIMSYILT